MRVVIITSVVTMWVLIVIALAVRAWRLSKSRSSQEPRAAKN